jgi:hypothetical protein
MGMEEVREEGGAQGLVLCNGRAGWWWCRGGSDGWMDGWMDGRAVQCSAVVVLPPRLPARFPVCVFSLLLAWGQAAGTSFE